MAISRERGRYIVWEGSEGVGKTTQMKLALAESARRGIETLAVREPGHTKFGLEIRNILLTPRPPEDDFDAVTEALLYLTDRSHLWTSVILPALERGIDVHSDRSWWSSLVYQGVAGGMNLEKLIVLTEIVMSERYIRPDIGLVFLLEEQIRKQRKHEEATKSGIGLDRIEQRPDEYFDLVASGYRKYPIGQFGAHAINASGTRDQVKARWWPMVFPPELDLAA